MLSTKINIEHITDKIEGQRLLIRVDFNVPITNGKITNTKRIVSTIPTIELALAHNPRGVILMSHLGRPKGNYTPSLSLAPIVEELEKLLGKKVHFLHDCVGEEVKTFCENIKDGQIVLLENLRFHVEETGKGVDGEGNKIKANPEDIGVFRQELTSLGDIYINDAFGTAHRDHSSMTGIKVPFRAAGLLLKKEIDYFAIALENPERPYLVILGGAKIHDKIQLIDNLLEKVDEVIIGGAMAFTFLKVLHDIDIGKSLFDEEGAEAVINIMEKAEKYGVKIHLPEDFLVGDFNDHDTHVLVCDMASGIPDELWGLDIGPKTAAHNAEVIARCNTIVWNGPQGLFENEKFRGGSGSLVHALMERTKEGTTTIVGGGDSVTMAQLIEGASKTLSHLSTGGGASLELLEGKELPGIMALSDIKDLDL